MKIAPAVIPPPLAEGGAQRLLNVTALARRVGVSRAVVVRLVSNRLLMPDAWIEFGDLPQPAFAETRAEEVLRHFLKGRAGSRGKVHAQ